MEGKTIEQKTACLKCLELEKRMEVMRIEFLEKFLELQRNVISFQSEFIERVPLPPSEDKPRKETVTQKNARSTKEDLLDSVNELLEKQTPILSVGKTE